MEGFGRLGPLSQGCCFLDDRSVLSLLIYMVYIITVLSIVLANCRHTPLLEDRLVFLTDVTFNQHS